jgi:hypothetical protein
VPVPLAGVSEIKIKVTQGGLSFLLHGFNILDDSGTEMKLAILDKYSQETTNQSILFPEPAGRHRTVRGYDMDSS